MQAEPVTHGPRLLGAIIAFGIASTALHFSHNFVEVDRYPTDLATGDVIRAAIVLAWPLFTAIALLSYRLYSEGRLRGAHAGLLAYSFFCFTSFGHFLEGTPDVAPFWIGTVVTDGLAGAAVLAFTIASIRTAGARPQRLSAG